MAFKFEIRQLVTVPETERQGEVMRRTESADVEPNYKLHWQVGGRPMSGWFSETDLDNAQVTPASKSPARKR